MKTLHFLLGIVLFVLTLPSAHSQNVKEFFGEDYQQAQSYLIKHKELLSQYSTFCKAKLNFSPFISSELMAAIVFPELVRLSRFKDFFETKALEYAYTTGGKETANFSIGPFQMRPSFIEDLENYVMSTGQKCDYELLFNYSSIDEIEVRSERLERMKQLNWQLYYLQSFIRIADEIATTRNFASDIEYLQFMSTFYNYGLTTEMNKIEKWETVQAFPMGSQFKGKQFSYAEVAIYFYENDAHLIFQSDSID